MVVRWPPLPRLLIQISGGKKLKNDLHLIRKAHEDYKAQTLNTKAEVIVKLSNFVKTASGDLLKELDKRDSHYSPTILKYIFSSVEQLSVISSRFSGFEDANIISMRRNLKSIQEQYNRRYVNKHISSKYIIIGSLQKVYMASIRLSESNQSF